MYPNQPYQVGIPADSDTWILVANRGGAKILASDGGTRNLRLLEDIPHPEGRLHDRDIDTDRAAGTTKAEGGANYPVNGLGNKHTTTRHVAQLFAKQIAEVLLKGRTHNAYMKLVLVAEPQFLGELRSTLDTSTQKSVDREINKDIYGFNLSQIKEHLSAHWLS